MVTLDLSKVNLGLVWLTEIRLGNFRLYVV